MIRFEDEMRAVPSHQESEGKQTEEDSDAKGAAEMEYRCRKCRRSLATSSYLIPHVPRPKQLLDAASSSPMSIPTARGPISSLSAQVTVPPQQCAHLFLEPLSWMRQELEQGKLDGRLECPNPKCKTNVGKYAWQGMRCSCGEWIIPGISLARGRVDELKLKTNGMTGNGRAGGKM